MRWDTVHVIHHNNLLYILLQKDDVDYDNIEPSADIFAPPRGNCKNIHI